MEMTNNNLVLNFQLTVKQKSETLHLHLTLNWAE